MMMVAEKTVIMVVMIIVSMIMPAATAPVMIVSMR